MRENQAMVWNILGWILAGLIVGVIARFLVPGRQPMGWLATIGLGLVGSVVGGAISWLIWGLPEEPFAVTHWPGYLMAIVGAFIVLVIYQAVVRRPRA
jgi:uncharacterized membrane protein YeaQ/YmgE (transglycosylase-associated protein family)